MKKLYRVSEEEVIAEYLKSEYFRREYNRDREKYESLVMKPDLSNRAEIAIRRQLLYRRHSHKWRELPPDTQWWVVELDAGDLSKLRILPRGHWSKMTDGKSISLVDLVARIRRRQFPRSTDIDVAIIQSLRYRMQSDSSASSVLIIGLDEEHELTILEGNHRLSAGLLASQDFLQSRFRVYAGFSSGMDKYWLYEDSIKNLCIHTLNVVRRMFGRDPEPPLEQTPQGLLDPTRAQGLELDNPSTKGPSR